MDTDLGPVLEEAPAGELVVDDTVLDQVALISDVDGVSVLRELVTVFISTSLHRMSTMEAALARGDLDQVGLEAHALAGGAGSLGAQRVAGLCRSLHAAATARDCGASRSLLDEIDHEFGRARALLLARARPSRSERRRR